MSDDDIILIWKRWDESYWISFNVFVIMTGLLLAGYSQVVKMKIIELAVPYCVGGFFISLIWLIILCRKYALIIAAESEKEDLFDKRIRTCKNLDNNKKLDKLIIRRFKKSSSGFYASVLFPILIMILWFVMLIITCFIC